MSIRSAIRNPMIVSQALELAVQHHQAGRLAEAEALYRRILAVQPNHADALHLIGVIAHQSGRHDLAADWIRRAIVHHPHNPAAYCNLGEACRALGRLDEAIAAFRRALQLKPDLVEACNNLGNALRDRGQLDEAVLTYRRALELKPNYPEAHKNLGATLQDLGQLDAAVAAYRRALELQPGDTEILNRLTAALAGQGRLEDAMAVCQRALQLKPDSAEAHNNLGNLLRAQGRLDEAAAAYRRAIHLNPGLSEPHNNLGVALKDLGQLDDAVAIYRRALELKPDAPDTLINLGNAFRERGQLGEAIAACRRALELQPAYPEAFNNLANALRDRGQLDEAVAACRRALELRPDYPDALNNLGNALWERGELDEAVASYRRALQIKPEDAIAHGNLIFTLNFHPGYDAATIGGEHRRWRRQFCDPQKQFVLPHGNNRNPERRLRIGYLSPDFRDHAVGRYVLPLFERHDREQFEILCYSGVARPDGMTERFRALAAHWRSTIGLPDARLAEMIREDGVDILVDLALHTAGNRLPALARRPAPVQVTWLGYPGSTGLDSIGYRLTDAHLEPPGAESAWPAEEPVRLPGCWCCFQPAGHFPEINALPALASGAVTFGSLNNFAKTNDGVWACWARVLQAVKGSRLIVRCPEGVSRDRVRAFFAARGIGTERVEWAGFLSPWEYLRLYQQIDLGLDPFPYNGITTTCDALWMGVPVLTLPGAMPASRASLSLLSSIGLGELAASSEQDYVRIAAELAADPTRLANLRAGLRSRMQASPLMDAPRFARDVETAYRAMWERWRVGQDQG